MNTQAIEKDWTELKARIKTKWSKFNDEEVESLKGDLSRLSERIQKSYGIAKEHADQQYEEFKKTIQSLAAPKVVTPVPVIAPKPVTLAADAPPLKASLAV